MIKKNAIRIYSEFCTGCGLCGSVSGVNFREDNKGFIYPDLSAKDTELCSIVCPSSGYALKKHSNGTIFGKIQLVKLGWSRDEYIRHSSSSGGVLTALCLYLLDNNLVDAIIQTRVDSNDKRKTETVVSTTREDVLSCMGSRYTTSSPLMNIKAIIEEDKTYAFIGKPCDVSALRMFHSKRNEKWTNQIIYMFSFFCAGQPSLDANNNLLKSLGCNDIEKCDDFQYRGNGWPGFATVKYSDGVVKKMDYEKSWMTILGRDVRKCCRFCADGTGEYADVSCGDAWNLTHDKKPDFTEDKGKNVIFARTDKGQILLDNAVSSGYVEVESFDIYKDELIKRQPYHYARKASLSSLKVAMLICGRQFPKYDRRKLAMFAKGFPLKYKVLRTMGTIHRILTKKI